MNVDAVINVKTVSEANQREHWGAKDRRRKRQQTATLYSLFNLVDKAPADVSLEVQFTRYGPGTLDTDNLAGSMKAIRDQVAAMLGRDDNPDAGIRWSYDQQRSKTYSVGVSIRAV